MVTTGGFENHKGRGIPQDAPPPAENDGSGAVGIMTEGKSGFSSDKTLGGAEVLAMLGMAPLKLAGLRGRDSYVDAEGDVVAEFGPGGVGADFDGFDLGGPLFREEDVVDVVGAIFVVPEIVSRLGLLALGLGKEMMIGAGEAVFL